MTQSTTRTAASNRRLSNRELIGALVDAAPEDPLWREFLVRFRPCIRLVVYRAYRLELSRGPTSETSSLGDAVEDLTQEVFVRLLDGGRRALSRFQGRSEQSAYTYLSTIAANLVRDHFKKLRALKAPRTAGSLSDERAGRASDRTETFGDAVPARGPGPERYAAAAELRARIGAVIDGLSPKGATSSRDRLIFRLYFFEGLTVDEIAKLRPIKLSASGVEKCVRRIRDALKERLSAPTGRSG